MVANLRTSEPMHSFVTAYWVTIPNNGGIGRSIGWLAHGPGHSVTFYV